MFAGPQIRVYPTQRLPRDVEAQVQDLLARRFLSGGTRAVGLSELTRRYPSLAVRLSGAGEVRGVLGVGHCAMDGGHAVVLGALALQPGYHESHELFLCAFREALWLWLRNPARRICVVGATHDPFAYAGIVRGLARVYPTTEVPALEDRLREAIGACLARYLGVERLRGANPDLLLFRGPSVALEREPDSRDPLLRYFQLANPGFRAGERLGFVIPCVLPNIARSVFRGTGGRAPRPALADR